MTVSLLEKRSSVAALARSTSNSSAICCRCLRTFPSDGPQAVRIEFCLLAGMQKSPSFHCFLRACLLIWHGSVAERSLHHLPAPSFLRILMRRVYSRYDLRNRVLWIAPWFFLRIDHLHSLLNLLAYAVRLDLTILWTALISTSFSKDLGSAGLGHHLLTGYEGR